MNRKRRKRLRVDRIIMVLVIFIVFIMLIKLGISSLINLSIYNQAKNSNTIKINSDKLKVWKKTINYIKENKDEITIKRRKYSLVFDTDNIKNDMNIKLNIYNERINKPLFNNVKSVYIKNNKTLRNIKSVKVKLPYFLKKKGVVDLYGIKNDKIELIKSNIKEKEYVTVDISDKYDDYFITYIKLKTISFKSSLDIKVSEQVPIELKLNPSNATDNEVTYSIDDRDIVAINKNKIIGKKKGSTKIRITSKIENVSYIVDVKVTEEKKEQETIKEEKKFEIEVKDGITYIDGTMIVNKTYSLPSTYDPGSLSDEFMDAFTKMQSAALLDGINLFVASGYRSYEYQVGLYEKYVNTDGKEKADTYSARPGHSEHQSGLAADINSADESFEGTKEAIWLDENCYKFGFVVRFPKGKEKYTGYEYEPWHLRYVGKELSKKIQELGGISLEEYFGITSEYKE